MDRKERKTNFIELGNIIQQTGEAYARLLVDTSAKQELQKITKLETEADMIQEELDKYFTTQKNIPYLSMDRAKLLSHMDEVMDQALLASKTIETFGNALPDEFVENAKELGEDIRTISSSLAEGVEVIYDDFDETLKITKKIEDIRDHTTDVIYNLEKQFFTDKQYEDDWRSFTAVSRISRRSMAIINACKTASDTLELMCMKYV